MTVGRLKLTSPGLLLILAIALAGGIFLLDVFYLRPYVDGHEESAFKEQAARAEQAASQGLRLEQANLLTAARAWSQSPPVRALLKGPSQKTFADFCRQTLELSMVDAAWLVDESGNVVGVWHGERGGGEKGIESLRQQVVTVVQAVRDANSVEPVGLLRLDNSVAMFARQPFHFSNRDGAKPAGFLWVCRMLDVNELTRISSGIAQGLILVSSPTGPPQRRWLSGEETLVVAWPAKDILGRQLGYFRCALSVGHIHRQTVASRRMVLIILSLSVGLVLLVILGTHILIAGPVVRLLRRLQDLERGDGSAEELGRNLHGEPLVLARRLESAFDRLATMSRTDPLTGLSNRRYFEEVLECFYHQARRYNRPLSVILMDVDFFKAVNDAGGHPAGDELLKNVAGAIENACRKADLPGRFGGDEFAILLPETSAADAGAVAERIRAAVAASAVQVKGTHVNVTASVGVADLNSGEIDSPSAMVDLADRALYTAKELGRNRVVQAHELTGVDWKSDAQSGNADAMCRKLAGLDTQFKDLFIRAIEEIVETLERRDPFMADHARKVRRYAELIAQEMGLPERLIQRLRVAAMLHDIGMVAMPDSILLCKEKLSAEQLEVMRRHPLIGVRMLEGMEFLEQEIPAVRYHHERYDGKGYPEGIAGATIPLTARVLQVADSFDAMISPRAFRDPKPRDEALDELHRGAGSQFDPAVVEAFQAVAERLGEDLLRLPDTSRSLASDLATVKG